MTERLPDRIETIDHVRAWDAAAERFETPCGAGYLVWRKWGSGPTVIFCHGGSGSWTHWCRTIPVVSKTHTVYAVDLPGLGPSQRGEGHGGMTGHLPGAARRISCVL